MQAASQNGHVDILKLLLKQNVDVEAEVIKLSLNNIFSKNFLEMVLTLLLDELFSFLKYNIYLRLF